MFYEGGKGGLDIESQKLDDPSPELRRPQTHLVQPTDMSGLMKDYTVDSELRSMDNE